MEPTERLKDPQGLENCISVHTLLEVGEEEEALNFCNSILRTPSKTIHDLQTRAYLTMVVAQIDKNADREVQFWKARQLWHRVKEAHDNAYSITAEQREVSQKNSEENWRVLAESLNEAEAAFKDELESVKSFLGEKITILEHDLLVARGRATLLEDQVIVKQDKISVLQAEVALLKSKPSSEYCGSLVLKQSAANGSSKYTFPWPLSLCLSAGFDSDEEHATVARETSVDKDTAAGENIEMAGGFQQSRRRALGHSMIIDTKRYSTAYETMSVPPALSPANTASDAQASSPTGSQASTDMKILLENGPILVRPGRPLAYVDDVGNIVEVDVQFSDLPPMVFAPPAEPRLRHGASHVSIAGGRHKSTIF